MSDKPAGHKKDGSVSKLRSHRGNAPVLPQTKLCPRCPAKFTRTTHLNRHLRTHSATRDYQCNNCGAGFTRSDLLTRHERSCNVPQDERRTRQRSCKPCSQLKVKCDLTMPCRKCRERGRQCVYPEGGRLPTLRTIEQRSRDAEEEREGESSLQGALELLHVHSTSTGGSYADTADSYSTTSYYHTASSQSFSASSSLHSALSLGYQSNMFEPLFSSIFTPAEIAPAAAPMAFPPPGGVPTMEQVPRDFVPITQTVNLPEIHPWATSTEEQGILSDRDAQTGSWHDSTCSTLSVSSDIATLRELHWYQYLYETLFVKQTHSLHATFNLNGMPGIFKRAMEAGGAMYAHNERAKRFIGTVFVMARTELPALYARDHSSATQRIYTLRATSMLQTMSLFEIEHRPYSITWFQLMIDMIRRTQTIEESTSWRPVLLTNATLEKAWRQWAEHEHIKRLVWMVYNRDSCMVTYLGHEPSFNTSELTLRLPCEECLWKANTAAEWLELLNQPSPYGTVEERLLGVPFHSVWPILSEPSPVSTHIPLGPLAHFHLIHVVLVYLFKTTRPTADKDAVVRCVQFALQNWLQSFLAAPEAPAPELGQTDPPFFHNSLPFYWFGQIALMAYQEHIPPFSSNDPAASSNDGDLDDGGELMGDERLELVKRWMLHIRAFLKRQDRGATEYWGELMRIRLDGAQAEDNGGSKGKEAEKEGLMSFLVTK